VAKKAKKAKKTAGSHQEGGKEDLKGKEVVGFPTEKLPPSGRNPDAKRNLSKGSQVSFGVAARHYKAGPLCGWRVYEGPAFFNLSNRIQAP
jgi:hypothetical protein